ncbi:hypothetical protein [Micromonospora aurantiaca (nom. illeg.)]|uniref:hypothetical protein n=1 Tax=Micromonospora aurantiaca (nom. illeg.) TaxID=47850 RepID=UPI0033E0F951
MTAVYDEWTPSLLAALASQAIEQHKATPGQNSAAAGCSQCTPTGCTRLARAERDLAEHRRQRAEWIARQPPR